MLTRTDRTNPFALAVLTALLAVSLASASSAQAAPLKLPKIKPPKISELRPQVRFVPTAKLSRGTVRLALAAELRFAGKKTRLSIFNMAVKKTKKSIRVNRKVGKLSVSLRISWEGTRTLTISGTARYLKFKVPVPRLRVRV